MKTSLNEPRACGAAVASVGADEFMAFSGSPVGLDDISQPLAAPPFALTGWPPAPVLSGHRPGEGRMPNFNRRDALKMSAGFAAATAGGFSCIELAKAEPIQVPVIDKLSVRVLVDSASDIFFKPAEVAGVKTEPGRSSNSLLPLHSEWGLSLYLEPQRGDLKRTLLLDFGWTPEAINGNMELLKVDPSKVDALIMSHGHWDHLGGMIGFLDRHRKSLPADLTIYAGGEDNFCQRYQRSQGGDLSDYGMLDRRDLLKREVKEIGRAH